MRQLDGAGTYKEQQLEDQRYRIERPFLTKTTAELRSIAGGALQDPDLLHQLYVELLFRKREAALKLRANIESILESLARYNHYFPWPRTEAVDGDGAGDDMCFPIADGMLGFVGYRVGASGVAADQRADLLDSVYAKALPPLNSKAYMESWGTPGTAARLSKLAGSLAAFARNAKRQQRNRLATAIAEWEVDLAYLKKTYYDGRYDFPWPLVDH